MMLFFILPNVYSMENKIDTNISNNKLEKSIFDSPGSMFSILKLEMENEFFVHFKTNDEEKVKEILKSKLKDKGKKKIRLMSEERTMKKEQQLPAKFSINDKIWIGPEKNNFELKTMDTMEKLFFERFDYRFDVAQYIRIKTEKQVSKPDYFWSWFVSHGIFYIPRTDRFYTLSFAAFYMKPKIGYEHKHSANPYCGIHWHRYHHPGKGKQFWQGLASPSHRKHMGLNMRIELSQISNETKFEFKR